MCTCAEITDHVGNSSSLEVKDEDNAFPWCPFLVLIKVVGDKLFNFIHQVTFFMLQDLEMYWKMQDQNNMLLMIDQIFLSLRPK